MIKAYTHTALYTWLCLVSFTQLGWDTIKTPFVSLSITVFAHSWSCGFRPGELFAVAPLPPTWLTDVWLSWYTRINAAVTDMFSFLPFISSFCLPVLQHLSKQCPQQKSQNREPNCFQVPIILITITYSLVIENESCMLIPNLFHQGQLF